MFQLHVKLEHIAVLKVQVHAIHVNPHMFALLDQLTFLKISALLDHTVLREQRLALRNCVTMEPTTQIKGVKTPVTALVARQESIAKEKV